GTDNGLYISMDRGQSFMTIGDSLPSVAVHDLVIQEEANDLVIGTHGRSIYRANIGQLQSLESVDSLMIFEIGSRRHSDGWGNSGWSRWFGYNEPEMEIKLFAPSTGKIDLELTSDSGLVLQTWEAILPYKGFNTITYDLTLIEDSAEKLESEVNANAEEEITIKAADNGLFYLPVGSYTLTASMGDLRSTQPIVIE
ncbi:MAG: glycosyl hydrolase, partial [Flavobacteriales bacterium]|nr:glycosyl hydrolase [Flavobacteriales bacterium]